jgi:hypothetical protein
MTTATTTTPATTTTTTLYAAVETCYAGYARTAKSYHSTREAAEAATRGLWGGHVASVKGTIDRDAGTATPEPVYGDWGEQICRAETISNTAPYRG